MKFVWLNGYFTSSAIIIHRRHRLPPLPFRPVNFHVMKNATQLYVNVHIK